MDENLSESGGAASGAGTHFCVPCACIGGGNYRGPCAGDTHRGQHGSPISCTVPAWLPVSLVDGYVVCANNAAITNTGKTGSIRVTKVDVQAGTFEIGNFDDFTASKNSIALVHQRLLDKRCRQPDHSWMAHFRRLPLKKISPSAIRQRFLPMKP